MRLILVALLLLGVVGLSSGQGVIVGLGMGRGMLEDYIGGECYDAVWVNGGGDVYECWDGVDRHVYRMRGDTCVGVSVVYEYVWLLREMSVTGYESAGREMGWDVMVRGEVMCFIGDPVYDGIQFRSEMNCYLTNSKITE